MLLLIEEPVIRRVFHTMLQSEGFQLLDVPPCVRPDDSAACGLECCANQPKPNLLIAEVIIPRGCSGIEAAHKFLRRCPDVKILLISASPRDMWPGDAAARFGELPSDSCSFLAKPFARSTLLDAIDRLVGADALRARRATAP